MSENNNWKQLLGMPTDIEFEKLKDAHKDPHEGDHFSDQALSDIIGVESGLSRFRTVIDRWRRYLMRHHNLLLLRERQKGYYIADAEQRLDHAVEKKERGDRQHRVGFVVIGTTDKKALPAGKQALYDHHLQCLSRNEMARIEDKRKMKILPPAPVKAD